jgi:hypothetical protein
MSKSEWSFRVAGIRGQAWRLIRKKRTLSKIVQTSAFDVVDGSPPEPL